MTQLKLRIELNAHPWLSRHKIAPDRKPLTQKMGYRAEPLFVSGVFAWFSSIGLNYIINILVYESYNMMIIISRRASIGQRKKVEISFRYA